MASAMGLRASHWTSSAFLVRRMRLVVDDLLEFVDGHLPQRVEVRVASLLRLDGQVTPLPIRTLHANSPRSVHLLQIRLFFCRHATTMTVPTVALG
jgi:hypothetical protein